MAEYIKQEISEQLGNGQLTQRAYYRLKTYSNFSMDQFVSFMVNNQGLKESEVRSVIVGMAHEVAKILALGHTVTIDGLGTFRTSLGVVDDKEVEGFPPEDEHRRNAQSVGVKNVLFKADKRFVSRVNGRINLERGEDSRISRPQSTREERLALLHGYLDKEAFVTIARYMALTGLNRSAATRELRSFCEDTATGIATQGRHSHKVYVRRTNEETED